MKVADQVRWMPLVAAILLMWSNASWAQTGVDRFEQLARECATEIPWQFDLLKASTAAVQQGKPVLVYVRCVNDRKGYDSAQQSVAARDVPLHDDGYRKDLLFRACVLADRQVQALVKDEFLPVCMTYHFETHGRGNMNVDWTFAGKSGGEGFTIDPDVGAAAPGSLRLSQRGSALQILARPPMGKGTYRLSASVKTEELNGQAFIRVLWSEDGASKQKLGNSTSISEKDTAWRRTSLEFEPSAKLMSILVMPSLLGSGKAWFDDLELREIKDGKRVGPNLLRNGDIDPHDGGGDPLIQLGEKATTTVTPALLVVRNGKIVRKLHRIGAMSPDYVERWLRSCLQDDQSKPTSEENSGKLAEAQGFLRKGEWAQALRLLTALRMEGASPEGQFWEGLCLHRLGRHTEARTRWAEAAGPTRWGRRSAACLLPRGPHPVLSLSERAWADPDASLSTEHPVSFDGKLALRILMEMQFEDGSFGDHLSQISEGRTYSHWQAAYTGIAIQAITAWMDQDPERKEKAEAAIVRARKFLVDWSKQQPRSTLGAFNHPYAIQALLSLGEKEAVQRLVDRVLTEQGADGTWSVYGPQRPTSFNTAQNLLALVAARKAGITVPEAAVDKACAALEKMRSGSLFPYSPNIGHGWMTTEFGSIARDPLCEHALLAADNGDPEKLAQALQRFLQFQQQLREPTKHYSSDFNSRGHGSYFLLFAYHNAIEAAAHIKDADLRAQTTAAVQQAMSEVVEKDSTAVDHSMYGRAYGTGMALLILAPRE